MLQKQDNFTLVIFQNPKILAPLINICLALVTEGFIEAMIQPHLASTGASPIMMGTAFFITGLVSTTASFISGFVIHYC